MTNLKQIFFHFRTGAKKINRKSYHGYIHKYKNDVQPEIPVENRGENYEYDIDEKYHVPRNPKGRTGIAGRGVLWLWGPNHAADPIITRWAKDKNGNILENSTDSDEKSMKNLCVNHKFYV